MDTPSTENTDTATSGSSISTPAQLFPTPISNLQGRIASAVDHHDDSASDISMSAETDDEDNEDDEESPSTPAIQLGSDSTILEGQISPATCPPIVAISNKRKYSDPEEAPVYYPSQAVRKRQKPEEVSPRTPTVIGKHQKPDESTHTERSVGGILKHDKSLLPAEIWHRVFSFVPPRILGLLLRVNKSFHEYLDPSSAFSITPLSKSKFATQLLSPDAVWRASRRLYWPGMPTPLKGKSELDMWRIACASSCQFCGKSRLPANMIQDQWHPGPGENGVAPIWAFGIHTCGSCLEQRSEKEITLLLSSEFPSGLLTALPWIFFSNEFHMIPHSTVQHSKSPSSIKIAKTYFQPQIQGIKQEFASARSMGSATAEEWLKGLDGRGKEARSDATRWEKWEASGGVSRMRVAEGNANPVQINGFPQPVVTMTLPQGPPTQAPPGTNAAQYMQRHGFLPAQLPQPLQSTFLPNIPQRFDSPSQNGFGNFPQRANPAAPRQERTKEQVVDLKAARRAEIERRCMLLDPPITAAVLAHMGSFQAAIQIIQPLTDSGWDVLKPRLLSQREDAQQRENERLAQARLVREQIKGLQESARHQLEGGLGEQWDDIQAPLRVRIGGYADETIRDGWAGGEKVSKNNCLVFAAQVLIYVRKRFYAELAKDEAAVRATGRELDLDPPNGPFTRKLTLENMKWVFDTKVKPHTEQYRKDVFLCHDCDSTKLYGFEGVIQHYAAKHTNTLSVGSVVVHWKSEWPDYTPFNPEPPLASNIGSYLSTAPSATPSATPYIVAAPQQNYGYNGYQQPSTGHTLNPHVYQESPGPYYGHPQYRGQQQNGPFAPPQPYQESLQSYHPQHYTTPANNIGYHEPPQDYSQQNYGGQYQLTTSYHDPSQAVPYPAPGPESVIQQTSYPQPVQQYDYAPTFQQPPAAQLPSQSASQSVQSLPPLVKSEEYLEQLQDVARNARDVWDTINGLKDLPGSVKVFTIIYHVLKRSTFRFLAQPSLAMIIDGLSSNKDMRKIRNINGLLCKACTRNTAASVSSSTLKRHYSFPQLVAHFNAVHEQGGSQNATSEALDWTNDMVELPDLTRLGTILNPGIGTRDAKLKLVVDALEDILEPPEMLVDVMDESSPHGDWQQPDDQDQYDPPAGLDNHEKYYKTVDSGRASEQSGLAYDDSQYDPRKPDLRDLQVTKISAAPVLQRSEDYYKLGQERREPSFIDAREPALLPCPRQSDGHGRVTNGEQAPVYLNRQICYRDDDDIEYRVRREPHRPVYNEPIPTFPPRDYRVVDSQAYHSNRQEYHSPTSHDGHPREIRYLSTEKAVTQQNRMFDVVAQISRQAKRAQERYPRLEQVDGGSEDGELRVPGNGDMRLSAEASNAADRFLDNFSPGNNEATSRQTVERSGDLPRMRQYSPEPVRYVRSGNSVDERMVIARGHLDDSGSPSGYKLPRQVRYAYEEPAPEQRVTRERSPELVDRRLKHDHVVYREDRQSSMRRTPSKYARYESVRLENDRARSRSPVYAKVPQPAGQYRERASDHLQQEPIHRTRSPPPQHAEGADNKAEPRQGYYRVYADESRPRPPVEEYEYVRVSDPQGDYMIRRIVRRGTQPVYATYEGLYNRQPRYESWAPSHRLEPAYYEEERYESRALHPRLEPAYYEEERYESRAPPPRPELARYEEEYDPHHPAPLSPAPAQQIQYQG